jgi:citronellol/citronellal dehydrogenase
MADAAHAILTRDARDPVNTGNFYIDDEVLAAAGVSDLSACAVAPARSSDRYLSRRVASGSMR